MQFYFTAKNEGGGRSFDVGLISYIYWTQKMLSVYLPLCPPEENSRRRLLYMMPDFVHEFDKLFAYNSVSNTDGELNLIVLKSSFDPFR